jgi:hypothetical protein
MKYFKIDESPANPGKFIIRPILEKLPMINTSGSYNILMARVMNLTYASYLRMCRDLYGADIIGKGAKYPVAYFCSQAQAKELVKELDKRVTTLLVLNGVK